MSTATEIRKLSPANQAKLIIDAPFADRNVYSPGRRARAVLHQTGVAVSGQDVVIGPDTYRLLTIGTTTGQTATLTSAVETLSLLTLSGAPANPIAAGDLVQQDSEIMKVVEVLTTPANSYRVLRGRCGTTKATHAAATVTTAANASFTTQVPVGLTALTATVTVAALAAEINNAQAVGTERAASKVGTIFDPGPTFPNGSQMPDAFRKGKVHVVALANNRIVVSSVIAEAMVLATTETMTNAAWLNGATMLGGADPTLIQDEVIVKVPLAAEVTAGFIDFPLPFTPRAFVVTCRVTATGLPKAWGGTSVFTANADGSGILTLTNNATVDWAATDTLEVRATS